VPNFKPILYNRYFYIYERHDFGDISSFTVILCPFRGSLKITEHEYPLMHYTKLISEEKFTAGRPMVIVLPLAEEGTTNEENAYLIEELQTSSR
jgi:hypothetical protein